MNSKGFSPGFSARNDNIAFFSTSSVTVLKGTGFSPSITVAILTGL
jgi:hypothetical protein